MKRRARIRFFCVIMDKILAPILFPFIGVPQSQASLGDGRDFALT